MSGDWVLCEQDRELVEELQGFVPEAVFDAHAHFYRVADLGEPAPALFRTGPAVAGGSVWLEMIRGQLGGARADGGLFFPAPTPNGDVAAANRFLVEELQDMPHSRGLALASPASDRRTLETLLDGPQIAGIKPYHCYADVPRTFDAHLDDYLPEWMWELADARRAIIMLHLVRRGALADPGNLAALQARCGRYPRAQVVLAHAARGFHAPNTVRAVKALRGLDNLWFDTSAVCEPTALLAILDEFGPRKLLWGSDFPVAWERGRCVTMGDGFAWVHPENLDEAAAQHCAMALVGLESLRALRDAAELFALNADDLRDVFHDNALRLLGLPTPRTESTQELYERAKQRIPGGTQLLSKRPELMAPNQWPAYYREARGCEIWDLEGRRFYDLSIHGIGACILGYRDPDVTRAVQRRVRLGSWCTLNPPEEVELADRLCEIHPWAEQARFTRCGGESAAVAVRIARATTGRSHVAICGYHGWHDWYLAANLGEDDSLKGHLLPGLQPAGVPTELRGTAHAFPSNNRARFEEILDAHGDRLAAVVMEPCRYFDPEPGFLEFVRDGAHRRGALLIFDEITIGWRRCYGGAHLRLGVNPDMALFAKSLGNGHPIGAVIGTRAAMEGAHESFISSSYWTEGVGPVAALASLDKMARCDVPAHVHHIGSLVVDAWKRLGAAHGLPLKFDGGYTCLAHFAFDHPRATELRTLYAQLMLERGFLAGCALYPTMAHTEEIVARYADAIDAVFGEIARALAEDAVAERLKGPQAHSGFARLL